MIPALSAMLTSSPERETVFELDEQPYTISADGTLIKADGHGKEGTPVIRTQDKRPILIYRKQPTCNTSKQTPGGVKELSICRGGFSYNDGFFGSVKYVSTDTMTVMGTEIICNGAFVPDTLKGKRNTDTNFRIICPSEAAFNAAITEGKPYGLTAPNDWRNGQGWCQGHERSALLLDLDPQQTIEPSKYVVDLSCYASFKDFWTDDASVAVPTLRETRVGPGHTLSLLAAPPQKH